MQIIFKSIYSWYTVCFVLLTLSINDSYAQSIVLLEACNSIENNDKRLICLKELSSFQGKKSDKDSSLRTLKNTFYSIEGAVKTGISYNDYKTLILEPAKEVSIFQRENSEVSKEVFSLLDQAVAAYNDAEIIWRAHIYKSQDAGFLGKILNYNTLELSGIVYKYNLPTRDILLSKHLPIDSALPIIWKHAENYVNAAFEIIEGKRKETFYEPTKPAQVRASTEEEILIEKTAIEMKCNTHPVAAQTASKDDYLEYSVYCSSGKSLIFRCTIGICNIVQ